MAELNSSEGRGNARQDSWGELERRLGAEAMPAREVDGEPDRHEPEPRPQRPSRSDSKGRRHPPPLRLLAVGGMLSAAALVWVLVFLIGGGDRVSTVESPAARPSQSLSDSQAEGHRMEKPVVPSRPARSRRHVGRTRVAAESGARAARGRRSGGARRDDPARSQPQRPPPVVTQSPTAPAPQPTYTPPPPAAEEPAGDGGLADGSRSSAEFGL